MTPRHPMVEMDGVGKQFGPRAALADVSFDVLRGEIFGLLGHNGAGKSTALGILLGLVFPSAGSARINGFCALTDRGRALRRVGAIFETPAFYDYLSCADNLGFFGSLSGGEVGRERFGEVVEWVGLQDRIFEPVRNYSHGMRQRLALAGALLHRPDLLVLDEPTDGLDPLGIQEMRDRIRRLREDFGITVLLSSHLLSEVQQLCDRIAILHRGKLVFHGRWQSGASRWRIDATPADQAAAALAPIGNWLPGGIFELEEKGDIADAVALLVGVGIRVRAVEPVRPSLEDFYLETCAQADSGPDGKLE